MKLRSSGLRFGSWASPHAAAAAKIPSHRLILAAHLKLRESGHLAGLKYLAGGRLPSTGCACVLQPGPMAPLAADADVLAGRRGIRLIVSSRVAAEALTDLGNRPDPTEAFGRRG